MGGSLSPPSTFRAMLTLALPVLAEESLNLLVGYTDWFLAGRFLSGREPLAAMGLMSYFLWMLPSFFTLVSIGALAVVARLIGAGQRQEAAHVARQALLLGLCAAAVGMLLALLLGGRFVAAMQLEGLAADLATRYMRIITPAIPFVMLEQVGTACLRGAGDTVTGLWARVAVNVVNVIVSTTLVAGLGPFPVVGWDGLAIGTACGHAVGGSIILWKLLRGGGGLRLDQHAAGRPRPLVAALAVGHGHDAPHPAGRRARRHRCLVGARLPLDLCRDHQQPRHRRAGGPRAGRADRSHVVSAGLGVSGCGCDAGRPIARRGRSAAGSTRRSAVRRLGLRDHDRSRPGALLRRRVRRAGVPRRAQRNVGADGPTAENRRVLLSVAGDPDGLLGALRGSGDTAWPLAITFIGLVGVRIPGACLLAWDEVRLPLLDLALPAAGLGVAGAWYAMIADVILRSLLAAGRFLHGGWQKVRV